MSNLRLKNYSDFTARVSGLIGIPFSGMNATEQGFIQGFFNTNMHSMWNNSPWLDISPYGEARFAGNQLTYPNDLSQTTYWTATAVTVTANALANPADGKVSASKVLETSATSAHKVSQNFSFIPNVNYQFSGYARPLGRSWLYLSVNDGAVTHTAYFNISTGAIGTNANCSQTPTIIQQNNGYWLCTLFFTSDASAGSGSASVQISTDGTTLSYAGDATNGIYSWGNLLLQTSFADPTSLLIPWKQTGEDEIDAVFDVWKDSPANAGYPRPQGFELNPNGIQLVGPIGYNLGVVYNSIPVYYTPTTIPVYIYYRRMPPDYSASAYDATAAYAVDDQILFTNSSNVVNFYKCLIATSAGQSPTTTAASWSLLEIPEVFFHFVVYASFADWLRMDGQIDKAGAMDALANDKQVQESDRQERQMAWVQPWRVSTHVTSRPYR